MSVFINIELGGSYRALCTAAHCLDDGFSSGHPLCCLFKSLKRKKKAAARGFEKEQRGISYSVNMSYVSPIVSKTRETVKVNRRY